MPQDLGLVGNRYSISIFIFTISSIIFQLPSTILMRFIGPRLFFSCITTAFGLITLCTAFITTWRQMIALRVLLGISMSGIYPGLTYLISAWYTRKEQQLRFAFLQCGEVTMLATGSLLNFGLNHLDHHYGLRGWQWMFLVQGIITTFLGLLTYSWMLDFPEQTQTTASFLTPSETHLAISRINHDRSDAGKPAPLHPLSTSIFIHFLDPKLPAFSLLFFLLNLISTALAYFLPIILQSGMGYSPNASILLSALPYYYAAVPALLTSMVGDHYRLRSPIITFNALTLILGFTLLGFAHDNAIRYTGIYLAIGAYVSNWAALNAYQANNITGQWKRATVAAAVSACNGLGGIVGSYVVRADEAPRYKTAVWVGIASHVLMVAVVGLCTVGFWRANRRQKLGKGVIEGVVGFRYTY